MTQLEQIRQGARQVGLETLLDYFTHQDDFSSVDQFYDELDEFLALSFYAAPLIVISRSIGFKYKFVWNENAIDNEYATRELLILNTHLLQNGDKKVSHCSDGYYIFRIGENQGESLWGFFKIARRNLMQGKVFDYFVKLVQLSYNQSHLQKQMEMANELIFRDDITGFYNQRKMHLDLKRLISRFHIDSTIFSVLFIDIDHFKNVNDGSGHLVGTDLLKQLAGSIRVSVRESDFLYRYGGDEFVVILPGTAQRKAKEIGTRLLAAIKSRKFKSENKNFSISLSIGISCFPLDAKDAKEILDVADQMMYRAKKGGRGQVCLASEIFS